MTVSHFVNVPLLKNPLNWAIIILMVAIAGFLVDSFATWNSQLTGRSH